MKNIFLTLLISCYSFLSFGQSSVLEKNGIRLTPVTDSPLFPDAKLQILSPKRAKSQDSTVVRFQYKLQNFKLTDQTSDAAHKHCNNSVKGQHIHLILNNEPYLAKYETDFKETLKEGNYVALSFLSRSYHESLKHKKAYQLIQFSVGTKRNDSPIIDLKKPLLFYSRPKGEYVGDDTKKVLLDFYIVNCTLSASGYKVKATINGTEFLLTNWNAYAMEGLPLGENSITLELLDKEGKLVESSFNKTTRKITLK